MKIEMATRQCDVCDDFFLEFEDEYDKFQVVQDTDGTEWDVCPSCVHVSLHVFDHRKSKS